ncbi:homoserine kinase [Lentibacillus sp. Marseille-P4043]|uniref:homoserine kinase n=1 Tax=Lentibacillus sp. Marseille-P4043 TaxID=2040293 RepID=UPI000D0AC5AF|nr:homoserine kinase [Lentibacillus sp. Marseille-P4043]
MNMFRLSLPASSANIGPCFDSAGIALNRYLTLEVVEHDKWEFEHRSPLLPNFSNHEDHFIFQIAERIAKRHNRSMPMCKITVDSEIPLARGLGSSASAVMAGIELANQLCNLALTPKEKLQYGIEIEGHPDNVAAVVFGGFIITAKTMDEKKEYLQLPTLDIDVVVYIPNVELKTEAARKVLPDSFTREKATEASSISNLMIASLLTGDYKLAGKMMENDLFHEPYRADLISHYHDIKSKAKKYGAYGTVISGAGPTMISFIPKGEGHNIAKQMKIMFPNYQIESLEVDHNGIQVTRNNN